MSRVALLFLLAALLVPGRVWGDDPRIRWLEAETPNFRIVYPARRVRFAARVAAVAERVHALLVPHMRWVPSTKTVIVVTDYTDMANGMAAGFLMNAITVYATGPQPGGELGDYDDWLWILLLHEYTHILHMDTTHGLPWLVDAIFGKWWVPNAVQPPWVLEGFAVYSESRFSTAGRNRASLYDMYMRTGTWRRRHLRLSDFGGFYYPVYPRGTLVYLYGSRFIRYLASSREEENIANLSHDYGARAMPYGVGKAVRNTFGGELTALYQEFLRHIDERYRDQIAAIMASGIREGRALTRGGEYKYHPVFAPSGPPRLVYVESDGAHPSRLVEMRLTSDGSPLGSRVLVGRVPAGGRPTWTPEGVMFSRIEITDLYYSFYDLYEVVGTTVRRITRGARLANPSWCRGKVVAAKSDGPRTWLVLSTDGGSTWSVLVDAGEMERMTLPAWSPDCSRVVFTGWRRGRQDIGVVEVATGKVRWLTHDRALDIDPSFSPDGRWVVFSSDTSGVFNVHAIELSTGQEKMITNVVGGAFAPTVSPDGRLLVYSRYDWGGYDLYVMPWDPDSAPDAARAPVRPRAVIPPAPYPLAGRPYVPVPRPRGWLVDVGAAAAGRAGAVVVGFDELMHHMWQMQGYVAPGRWDEDAMASLSYTYSGWWAPVELDLTWVRTPTSYTVWDGWYPLRFPYVGDSWSVQASTFSPLVSRIYGVWYGYASLSAWGAVPHMSWPVTPPDAPVPDPPDSYVTGSASLSVYYMDADTSPYALLDWEHGISMGAGATFGEGYALGWASVRLRRRLAPLTVLDIHAGIGAAHGWDNAFSAGGPSVVMKALPRLAPRDVVLYDATVRGYRPSATVGPSYWAAGAFVAFPMRWLLRGLATVPVYLRRIWGRAYLQGALAGPYTGLVDVPLVSVGGEIALEAVEFFHVPVNIVGGAAWGLTRDGGIDLYTAVSSSLPSAY